MIRYVALEREYGSGGREVARILSERCGIPAFGKEILEQAARVLMIPVSQLEQYEESATNSFLYSVSLIGKLQCGDPDLLMREGHLYLAEQKAIRMLAAGGPAVFVGHCAAEALKDCGPVLRVFIKSTPEARKRRITREYGIPEEDVAATIRRFDRKRAGYYAINTARKWRDPDNYDLILDSASLGTAGCASAIEALISR